jgi:hypothetical protein
MISFQLWGPGGLACRASHLALAAGLHAKRTPTRVALDRDVHEAGHHPLLRVLERC